MYMMGVQMACIANPDETCRHKERQRQRCFYVFQGKKVCLDAFLYLENTTHYQMKRIRKHIITKGIKARIHGNMGRKPHNTFSVDIYQHASAFLHSYMKRNFGHNIDSSEENQKEITMPIDLNRRKIHNDYKEYCENFEPDFKMMGYSTFRQFMTSEFPYIVFDKRNIKDEDDKDYPDYQPVRVGKRGRPRKPKIPYDPGDTVTQKPRGRGGQSKGYTYFDYRRDRAAKYKKNRWSFKNSTGLTSEEEEELVYVKENHIPTHNKNTRLKNSKRSNLNYDDDEEEEGTSASWKRKREAAAQDPDYNPLEDNDRIPRALDLQPANVPQEDQPKPQGNAYSNADSVSVSQSVSVNIAKPRTTVRIDIQDMENFQNSQVGYILSNSQASTTTTQQNMYVTPSGLNLQNMQVLQTINDPSEGQIIIMSRIQESPPVPEPKPENTTSSIPKSELTSQPEYSPDTMPSTSNNVTDTNNYENSSSVSGNLEISEARSTISENNMQNENTSAIQQYTSPGEKLSTVVYQTLTASENHGNDTEGLNQENGTPPPLTQVTEGISSQT